MNAAILALVPSLAVGVVGYLLKRLMGDLFDAITELRAELKELRGIVTGHQTDLGKLEIRVTTLEHEVAILRKAA